jgi:hypothetical protein
MEAKKNKIARQPALSEVTVDEMSQRQGSNQ